jgi:hypothetical protein
MLVDQEDLRNLVLARLNDLYEEDFNESLDVDEFCNEFSLSQQQFRSLLTPLYRNDWVPNELEEPTLTIRLTPSGKEAYDIANGITANEKTRHELLNFLAAAYEKDVYFDTDTESLAKELGLGWNKVCFNLLIMQIHGLVCLNEEYGVGHSYYRVSLTPEGKYVHDNPEPKIVFLSHAAADQEIAKHLKHVIENSFAQIKVFVSSDPEDLPPGDPWVQTVLANLNSAKMLLILATERGLNRKWVWFETGAGWSCGLHFIPCCIGRPRKGQLPHPFSGYQALNIDEEGDLESLVNELEKQFGRPQKPPDSSTVIAALIRLNISAEQK